MKEVHYTDSHGQTDAYIVELHVQLFGKLGILDVDGKMSVVVLQGRSYRDLDLDSWTCLAHFYRCDHPDMYYVHAH